MFDFWLHFDFWKFDFSKNLLINLMMQIYLWIFADLHHQILMRSHTQTNTEIKIFVFNSNATIFVWLCDKWQRTAVYSFQKQYFLSFSSFITVLSSFESYLHTFRTLPRRFKLFFVYVSCKFFPMHLHYQILFYDDQFF